MTVVPSVARGGGRGLFDRNNGCMSPCIEVSKGSNLGGAGLFCDEDVGREKFGGLDGGEDVGCRGDELHPTAVAVSEVAACGELDVGGSGRNGPFRASAGDPGRLPGIVANPVLVAGDDEYVRARIS